MKLALFSSGFALGWLLAIVFIWNDERERAVAEAERVLRARHA